MTIQVGQFWTVENGSIFKVTALPAENNSCYVGNRLTIDGSFCEEVGVSKENFELHLDKRVALERAETIVKHKVATFFK